MNGCFDSAVKSLQRGSIPLLSTKFLKNKIMKRVTILSVIVVLLLLVMVACQYPIFAKVVAVIFCLSAFILAAVIILSISVNSDDEDL